MFIDIHAHLDFKDFSNDIDKVILNAKNNNVNRIISNGIDLETNKNVLKLSRKFDIIKPALGAYPPDALVEEKDRDKFKVTDYDIDSKIDFIRKNKDEIIAIGEIGMDFKYFIDQEFQKKVFEKMIRLSEELKKPMIVHSRKAESEVIEMLETSTNKKINMHCFCGKKKLVNRIYDNGWFFSIPSNVVNSQQFQEIVKIVDINHLFCETDSPLLSPFKGQRNEPANVVESYKKIAEIKGMDLKEVENNIEMNYKQVFE